MAAAPAFQHKSADFDARCYRCQAALEGYLSRHICPSCGYPQPKGRAHLLVEACVMPDYFLALGAPRRFAQNRAELEKRFYEVSRALHPDRFTTADPEARRNSLERMSFLNEAYRTLKDPAALREYLLQLEGVKLEAKGGQVPVELAESWFELQDALTEDPDTAKRSLAQFEEELQALRESNLAAIRELEKNIDQSPEVLSGARPPRALLERLAKEIQAQTYLQSMERDVARLKSRLTVE